MENHLPFVRCCNEKAMEFIFGLVILFFICSGLRGCEIDKGKSEPLLSKDVCENARGLGWTGDEKACQTMIQKNFLPCFDGTNMSLYCDMQSASYSLPPVQQLQLQTYEVALDADGTLRKHNVTPETDLRIVK